MLLTLLRGRVNLKGSIFREPDGTLDKGATGRSPLRDQTRGLWAMANLDHNEAMISDSAMDTEVRGDL